MCFFNLGEEKILKVAGFVIFPTSIMVLFEMHQRFKGHFLNELRVSFNKDFCKIFKNTFFNRAPPVTASFACKRTLNHLANWPVWHWLIWLYA